ncbi:HAD family hydrolase [Anaerosacchariphilus polymeriproducens]|uniref:HAD family hydrolase n=1 Tax=Anaerosacchariphilus polymeriproducens TaxID=1812858 RepID=A0A371AV02_9FIRM|nr:HAD family hydrolase [Anaerosacchariphilus polymeriproducens]RDU23371.1 HAD family hydrolase [Anaerosacchariphilus polymeriproducens]
MIKLIASDIDGTLLEKSGDSISESMIEIVKVLIDKGIIFVAASGRQYDNLRRLFSPIKDQIGYIAENGSQIYYKEHSIMQEPIAPEVVRGILEDVYEKDECEVVMTGKKGTYIQPKGEFFRHYMEEVLKYDLQIVDDILAVEDEILKISIQDKNGIDEAAVYFKEKWGKTLSVVTSGIIWMDLLAFGVNKGSAMRALQEKLDIKSEECIAFGDNYNDVEMFESVGTSYAMSNAEEDIRNMCNKTTNSVENTLLSILEDL